MSSGRLIIGCYCFTAVVYSFELCPSSLCAVLAVVGVALPPVVWLLPGNDEGIHLWVQVSRNRHHPSLELAIAERECSNKLLVFLSNSLLNSSRYTFHPTCGVHFICIRWCISLTTITTSIRRPDTRACRLLCVPQSSFSIDRRTVCCFLLASSPRLYWRLSADTKSEQPHECTDVRLPT